MASCFFLAVTGLLALATYRDVFVAPLLPGFVAAYHTVSHLHFHVASDDFFWIFIPAVLTDLILYAILFYLIASLALAFLRPKKR